VIQRFKEQAEPYSLAECCQALGVSRSGWYGQKSKNTGVRSTQDVLLSTELRRSFLASRKTYGCRRLQRLLLQQGIRCGKNRINRLMGQLGLRAIQKRRFRPQTTQSRHNEPIAPNRLKERLEEPTGANEVWLADITYLPTLSQGWLYLAVEMDLYSRAIVGWKLGQCLAAPLAIEAFQRAVKAWALVPQIHHSDRGVQYAASTFRQLLKSYGVCSSMSRTANPYDNAVMESFFATLKTECFQELVPLDQAQTQRLLFDYIETFYNPKRLHSALAYRAPLELHAAPQRPY
jgi:transposase InsO family protein